MFELKTYVSPAGKSHFTDWLNKLRDMQARARIDVRLNRLANGLTGDMNDVNDMKFVGEGVSEPRIDWGPGYRVYFARDGATVVLLLCGGDKRTQQKDIDHAIEYWKDYQTRRKQNR
jgi:putative addiction module killer protein